MYKAPGLEVDARQPGLHPPDASSPEPMYNDMEPNASIEPKYKAMEPNAAVYGVGTLQETPRRSRTILGLRRTTFALSTALIIVLILGIVSAVGAGTCASKNGGFTGSAPPIADTTGTAAGSKSETTSPSCPTSTSTSSSSSSSSSNNDTTSAFQPTSNCTDLGPHYASALTSVQFSVYCSTDFPGSDILGLFMYAFEDCIEACANFNNKLGTDEVTPYTACSGVSYVTNTTQFPAWTGAGNCFLKNGTTEGRGRAQTDSATLVKS